MHWKKFCLLILPLCFTVGILISLTHCFATPQYDKPPLIVINGTTYKGMNQKLTQLPPDSIYLGTVLSSVSSSEVPTENFQANDEITGSSIYQVGDDVVVYYADQWWIYKNIES